jgi:hypothetical protein
MRLFLFNNVYVRYTIALSADKDMANFPLPPREKQGTEADCMKIIQRLV